MRFVHQRTEAFCGGCQAVRSLCPCTTDAREPLVKLSCASVLVNRMRSGHTHRIYPVRIDCGDAINGTAITAEEIAPPEALRNLMRQRREFSRCHVCEIVEA